MLVEGPIGTEDSLPYGTARVEGGEARRLLTQFDYVEEEYFFSGTANVYGPVSFEAIEPGEPFFITRRPLSTVHRARCSLYDTGAGHPAAAGVQLFRRRPGRTCSRPRANSCG